MGQTLLADVIVPEVFQPYVIERTAQLTALIQMGVIARSPELDRLVQGPGELIQMPFWKDLTGSSQIVTSGGTVLIDKITTGKDQAQRLLRAKGWGAEDIAGLLAGSDPMRAIGDLVAGFWARDFQATVVATLTGVFGAASMSPLVLSIAQASGSVTSANTLNGSTFIDATGLMGDNKGKLTAVAMHSDTERALLKLDLIDFVRESQGENMLKKFQGFDVIVDDSCPTRTLDGRLAYTTYLFGQGAIGYGENTAAKPIAGGIGDWYQELSRDAESGVSKLINRRDMILHPRGVKFTQIALAAETPTDAELATGTNWVKVYETKNVRLVKIEHNNVL